MTATSPHAIASRTVVAMLGLSALAPAPAAAQASAQPPGLLGRWATPTGGVVEFQPCAEPGLQRLVCGRIVALDDPSGDGRDVRNPNARDRTRPILGLQIVRGLRPAGPGVWNGADLYNPDDGHTYRGAIRLRGADSLELRGCALAVLCQTQTWRRIEPLAGR